MALDVVTYVLCKNFTKSQISEVISSLGEGMRFKGSVAKQSDLPLIAQNGDLYIITDQKCKAVRYNNAWLIFDYQPTKVSQLTNDSGYITEAALVDLATKAEMESLKVELESKIPSKTSQLTNDSGFLTEHQSLDAYRKSAEQDVIDAGKQDKLTSENGIKLVNNVISAKYDNETIKLNNNGELFANIDISGKQDKLIAGSGIKIADDEKTISADVRTYKPFLSSWPVGSMTTKASFFDAVNASYASGEIKDGDVFLGHIDSVNFFDGAYVENGGTLASAEVSVQIMKSWGTGCVQLLTTTSSNNPPYHWEFTHVDDIASEGWRCWSSHSYIDDKLDTKQDRLTAGENISIVNNVISATGTAKMGRTFATRVTVGNLTEGSQISENDSVADILYKILYGTTGALVDLYYGATDNIPVDLTGLTVIKDQDVDVILQNGKAVRIYTGNVLTEEGQHAVFACAKGTRLISLSKWYDETETFDIPFKTIEKDTYNLYYLEEKTYDEDIGGTMYHFKFVEGA